MKYTNTLDKIIPKLKQLEFENRTKVYDVEVKIHRNRKTKLQNDKAWKLITAIAMAINSDKDTVYLQLLERYAPSALITLPDGTKPQDYGIRYYTTFEDGYMAYKGISEMDTKEMSYFLEMIIEECKEMEIEYLSPSELALLKGD